MIVGLWALAAAAPQEPQWIPGTTVKWCQLTGDGTVG